MLECRAPYSYLNADPCIQPLEKITLIAGSLTLHMKVASHFARGRMHTEGVHVQFITSGSGTYNSMSAISLWNSSSTSLVS
jgi:hypothetical protein